MREYHWRRVTESIFLTLKGEHFISVDPVLKFRGPSHPSSDTKII